ncbi:FAD-dependent oxidoreductase [Agromyces humatus]|uniref:NAD(P)/FAD-dependent oxidoreductase n=1 Tax=Agromyces humatus TaxID=279573 RepID=A0ABP4WGF0_9MICO|nr:NAD(P)/FAD-dependent oxidoreductase [Agromyces humatus]
MRVVISGAGLGGLVLAHALRAHADVTVVERDAAPGETGGYRIALTPEAVAVVERHVPAPIVERIRAVSDGPETFSQFTIADARLRPILIAPEPPGRDRMLCQRRALRTLLAEGLDERVRYSSTVVAAEASARGAAVVLDDGTRVEGDVVVAADGARSPTLRSIAQADTDRDLGLIGIAGSTPLTGDRRFPGYLGRGPALAIDHEGTAMFLSLASRRIGAVPPELADAVGPPSLVWGLIARRDAMGDLTDAAPARLAGLSAERVATWHPWMSAQIEATDPDRTAAFAFRVARTTGRRFPWAPSRITAIGDAVHAMPPTGGRAGSTAIRSAGALADALIDAIAADARGGGSRAAADRAMDDAIARYEGVVDEWAVPAIRESLAPVRIVTALSHPLTQQLARPLLAVAGVAGATRYRRLARRGRSSSR